jgi:hypothetical protein
MSGWLGLGTVEEPVVSEFTDPRPSFVPFTEFGGYSRAPVAFGPALTGRIDRFAAPAGPVGAVITHGALFDRRRRVGKPHPGDHCSSPTATGRNGVSIVPSFALFTPVLGLY